jgi:hypothetical protein
MLPAGVFAETGTLTPLQAIAVLNDTIRAFQERIVILEAENQTMRYQLQNGIFNIVNTGSAISTGTTTPTVMPPTTPPVVSTATWVTVTESNTGSALTSSGKIALAQIALTNPTYAGFIERIHNEWAAIRSAYALPSSAVIAGYEFVQSGALDHVFVDINSSSSYSGQLFEWKILYQFNSSYQRKLVWYFELNATLQKYVTKKWANPFAWVPRTFVRDPFLYGAPPSSLVNPPVVSTGSTTTSTGWTSPTTVIPPTSTTPTNMTEIQKAYNEKRYLSVISLSNTYLLTNSPTADLLRMRYRTFFIIGKYTDSLGEIQKIQTLQGGTLERTIACDAQVIATYSKDQKLIDSYTKICKG